MMISIENLLKVRLSVQKLLGMKKEREAISIFLNLESHNKIKSSVRKIFNREGALITDP